jgi:hypothetical protein
MLRRRDHSIGSGQSLKDKSSKKSCEEKDDRGKMLRLEILWHQPCAKMRVHTNADSLNLLGR